MSDDEETSNIRMYGRVFKKCLEEAGAVGKDLGWVPTDIREFARVLFDRFWEDQGKLWKSGAPKAERPG